MGTPSAVSHGNGRFVAKVCPPLAVVFARRIPVASPCSRSDPSEDREAALRLLSLPTEVEGP